MSTIRSKTWGVCFGIGGTYSYAPSYSSAVRMVRGGQPFDSLLNISRPSSDYVDNGDGTITHAPTKLMWKRCAEGQTWTGSTCSGTATSITAEEAAIIDGSFAGLSDWRLPTADELLSLVDYSTSGPSINSSMFPATPGSNFWSSSIADYDSSKVWYVNFSIGNALYDTRNSMRYTVRLVRSLVPVCTLESTPASYAIGDTVTLTARCNPGVTSYFWSGGTCAGTTAATCTVVVRDEHSLT